MRCYKMGKKKILSFLLAMSIALSGGLCGCSKEESSSDSEAKSTSETDKDKKSIEKKENDESSETVSKSTLNKIYTDYLNQQRLCKISKDFRILEPGTAKENPNGLADAVKYDFDGDKIDELVTFTFERNTQNGEDIRIDFLKISNGKLNVADSKYLTEILEINTAEGNIKDNTIYFNDIVSMQLVTSEYQDALYFGFVLSNENNIFEPNPPREYMKSMSVFTIEDSKISPCMIAGTYQNYSVRGNQPDQGVLYASLLPPSIRDTTEDLGTCIVDENKLKESPNADYIRTASEDIIAEVNQDVKEKGYYTLYSNIISTIELNYCVTGGLYNSSVSAYSALLNEFGLDLEYVNYGEEDDFECTAQFVSKNQSKVKKILEIDAVRGYTKGYESSNYYEDSFIASQLTLSSDLEELIGNDSPFTEPFSDEIALYEDILRYPHYYHEVWDAVQALNEERQYLICSDYSIADINNDGKYELIMPSYSDSSSIMVLMTIVLPDGTIRNISESGHPYIYDNGIVVVDENGGAYNPIHYIEIESGKSWTSCDQKQEDGSCISAIFTDDGSTDEKLLGEEADKKMAELRSGKLLVPDYVRHDLYDSIDEIEVTRDASEIEYTWRDMYKEAFEGIGAGIDSWDNARASIMYIDDDDIPEILIENRAYDDYAYIYTIKNNKVYQYDASINGYRVDMGNYKEKGNMFYIDWRYASGDGGGCDVYTVENGMTQKEVNLEEYDGKHFIDGEEVAEAEYNAKWDEIQKNMNTEPVMISYNELMQQLSGE